jgi:hypothetical protein
MIEMRVVDNGLMCRPDFQYRYKNQLPPGCIPDQFWKEWSEWITAEQVKEEESKEEPKTLDEIQQELDEKIDKLIKITKGQFEYSKIYTENGYDYKFDKIIENFEYARKNGNFPLKLNLAYTTTGLSAYTSPYTETSFIIKQGSNHKGYYTIGNQRYFRYYMPDKPNRLVRFFMKTCLGFVWIDE